MTLPGETVGTGAPGLDKDPNVHGPKVMKSAAGYYVGYAYIDPEIGAEEPYTKESRYYPTHEEAVAALPSFISDPSPDTNFHARGTQFDPSGVELTEIGDAASPLDALSEGLDGVDDDADIDHSL